LEQVRFHSKIITYTNSKLSTEQLEMFNESNGSGAREPSSLEVTCTQPARERQVSIDSVVRAERAAAAKKQWERSREPREENIDRWLTMAASTLVLLLLRSR
jgi:hypothetical protein